MVHSQHTSRRIMMRFGIILLMVWCMHAVVMAADTGSSERVATAKVKEGLIRERGVTRYYENGEKLTNAWKRIDGAKYYFRKNGDAAVGSRKINGKYYVFDKKGKLKKYKSERFMNVNGSYYFVTKNSMANPGWHVYQNRLFYAKTNGKLAVSRYVDGVLLNEKGFAVYSLNALAKREALKTLEMITTPKMTIEQKRKACWDYLQDKTVFSYYPKYPDMKEPGWQRGAAWDMLITHKGNCYSFACAFAALTHELGDRSEVIPGSVFDGFSASFTAHCWTRVNGLFYDPEAKYAGWAEIYGNEVYSKRNQMDRPVVY